MFRFQIELQLEIDFEIEKVFKRVSVVDRGKFLFLIRLDKLSKLLRNTFDKKIKSGCCAIVLR